MIVFPRGAQNILIGAARLYEFIDTRLKPEADQDRTEGRDENATKLPFAECPYLSWPTAGVKPRRIPRRGGGDFGYAANRAITLEVGDLQREDGR
jgi:hypothetical protein